MWRFALDKLIQFLSKLEYNITQDIPLGRGRTAWRSHSEQERGEVMSDHVCSCGGNCGCNEDAQFSGGQVYLTRDEYIVRLEQYLGELKAEIASVEGELAELRSETLAQAAG